MTSPPVFHQAAARVAHHRWLCPAEWMRAGLIVPAEAPHLVSAFDGAKIKHFTSASLPVARCTPPGRPQSLVAMAWGRNSTGRKEDNDLQEQDWYGDCFADYFEVRKKQTKTKNCWPASINAKPCLSAAAILIRKLCMFPAAEAGWASGFALLSVSLSVFPQTTGSVGKQFLQLCQGFTVVAE